MAHLLSLKLVCLLLFFFFFSSASHHHNPQQTPNIIHEACKASQSSQACEDWLSHSGSYLPPNATVLEAIKFALSLTTNSINKGRFIVKTILTASRRNKNLSNAATGCLAMLDYSKYRINMVGRALTSRKHMKDARAWMSAALVFQYDCWSGLKQVNGTHLVAGAKDFFNSTLIQGSSSALGMIVNDDIYGAKTGLWRPPQTERDGSWEPVSSSSGSGSTTALPDGLKENVTVCKGGGGCRYRTVQEAVDASPNNTLPGKWFVIRIRAGVYEETVRVSLEKKNVVFWGDGMGKTVIIGSKNVGQQGMSTFDSATVGVLGDRFMASNLTIKNIAGPDAHQAVAFLSCSDRSVLEKCEFVGNQDTLYAHSLRQYYKSCRIQGNVDFIFGNSAAFFQDCLILLAPRQLDPTKGEQNVVTAQGRTDPAQSTGFVFLNSTINGTKAYMDLYYKNRKRRQSYLGRPWKEYSRTVFVRCALEELISNEGWMPWKDDFALRTLYYGEYRNTGAGSNWLKRVPWSSQIPEQHVASYSVQNFIQAY